MTPALSSFLTGLFIGGGASLLGGALSYWFGLRRAHEQTAAPLAYLFLVPTILSLLGAAAIVAALFGGRPVALVLLTGLGVVIGFTMVFALLLVLWIRRDAAAKTELRPPE